MHVLAAQLVCFRLSILHVLTAQLVGSRLSIMHVLTAQLVGSRLSILHVLTVQEKVVRVDHGQQAVERRVLSAAEIHRGGLRERTVVVGRLCAGARPPAQAQSVR